MARTPRILIGGAALVLAGALGAAVHGQTNERVIEIAVKRFEYIPPEITVRKGEPVRLALSSLDRRHGFKLPELGVRADVEPDQTVVVRIVPTRAGRFVFACDIFCGDDHEDMQGIITVTE